MYYIITNICSSLNLLAEIKHLFIYSFIHIIIISLEAINIDPSQFIKELLTTVCVVKMLCCTTL